MFLRGFDTERRESSYAGPNQDIGTYEASLFSRPIEGLLTEMLCVPLLTLPDPRDPAPDVGAFRFERVPEFWRGFVEELCVGSIAVFVYITSLTPGIVEELDLLRNSDLRDKTIVVVGKVFGALQSEAGQKLASALSDFPKLVFQQSPAKWSRQEERSFQGRLLKSITSLEGQIGSRILDSSRREYTLATPFWGTRLLQFIYGPAIGVTTIIIILGLFEINAVVNHGLPRQTAEADTLQMFLWWLPLGIAVISVLKAWFRLMLGASKAGQRKADKLVNGLIASLRGKDSSGR
jgi:hypothetical protein